MADNKLINLSNSIEHSFGEIVRKIMRQKMIARASGNEPLAMDLHKQEMKIRTDLNTARDKVFAAQLSSDKIDRLVSELDNKAQDARDALEKMRDLKKFLEKVKQAADVAKASSIP